MNMKKWLEDFKTAKVKKPCPVLSFPSIQLLGIGVKELISDSDLQAKGMKMIADKVASSASVSMMDLSVEAEAFGSTIKVADDEVPTVVGHIIETPEQADALKVPEVGAGRTGLYIEAIAKAVKLITDRPVLAGVIGPFSLAGRLLDVSEAMIYCYEEPEMVETVLDKVTEFLIKYCNAYKAVGASGVFIAEPLAGLLTPDLNRDFSVKYMKKLIDAVQDDNFIVFYHNCGNGTLHMTKELFTMGASAYHFGNAIDLKKMLELAPANEIVMGNVDPAAEFCHGTPESIRKVTLDLLEQCNVHSNFVLSSGCDIPPMSKWENIEAFFKASEDFYSKK